MTGAGSFWTRRKAAVAAEARAEATAREAEERQAQEQALAERPDEELLAEAGLPEPEALTSAEEVRDFLKATLSQRLKTRALRRLWRLNPVLANLDGLVDYGEDYTDASRVVETLQTAYQVGKGMAGRLTETAETPQPAADGTDPAPDESEDATPEIAAAEEAATPDAPGAPDTPAYGDPEQTDASEPALAPSRRMRFRFDEQEGAA